MRRVKGTRRGMGVIVERFLCFACLLDLPGALCRSGATPLPHWLCRVCFALHPQLELYLFSNWRCCIYEAFLLVFSAFFLTAFKRARMKMISSPDFSPDVTAAAQWRQMILQMYSNYSPLGFFIVTQMQEKWELQENGGEDAFEVQIWSHFCQRNLSLMSPSLSPEFSFDSSFFSSCVSVTKVRNFFFKDPLMKTRETL